MNNESVIRCPKCQAVVPPEAPQGLCPQCLLGAAATPTEAGQPADLPPPPSVEAVAAAFPQLEILELIGQGGMGVVYKARQPKLDRLVALKLLPQKPGADPAFGERFHREARFLARLSHPNIVAVHDFGQTPGYYYLVMEFVDGVNLRQAMRAGRFTAAQALTLVPKICDALQYAHEEGVLHRDIKPENLLLDTRGRVKIADFGIAKLQGEGRDITLTASGAAVGTPHYMAPEQWEHPQDVDQRADIYSLGVVFYEMLTGELPLGRFAPPSEKSAVDTRIDEIVFRALERERERRFQTAGEVKTRVENVTANPTPPKPAEGASPSPAPNPPGHAPAPPSGPAPWSRRAIVAGVLVGASWNLTLALLFVSWGPSSHERLRIARLALAAAGLAIWGAAKGWAALREIRAAHGQRHGRGFAWFAVTAYLVPMAAVWLAATSARFAGGVFRLITPEVAAFTWVAFLGLNGLWFWRWFIGGADARTRAAQAAPASRGKRLGWLVAGIFAIALLAVCIVGFVSLGRRWDPPTPTVALVAGPEPPPGYAVAPSGYALGTGSAPENNRPFQATLTVPGGYALTITATCCSNQVVLRRDEPLAAFVIAPAGQDAEASLTWRLLGNTALADGAPLEFSLALNSVGDSPRATFQFTPPVPLTIDWASEPGQLWPPQNGHTKFLLVKGMASGPPPGASASVPDSARAAGGGIGPDGKPTMVAMPPSSVTPPGLAPEAEAPWLRPAIEWAVGIEMRLDPLPNVQLAGGERPRVGTGTNWMAALTGRATGGAAESPSR